MSRQLYLIDAYQKKMEAIVEAVVEGGVILNQTVFYAAGGGQPSDRGELRSGENSWQVEQVKKVNGQIVHFLKETADHPVVGQPVTGILDWDYRYQLMRTHTAMHLLCGVVWRDYQAQVTGGNMEPLKGRMDFEFESMKQELVTEIEAAVNKEVEAARMVMVDLLPRKKAFEIPDLIRTKINLLPEGIEQIRTVEIVDLDLQADGGTHVANTHEVGPIKIVNYKSKGKINKRIYLELSKS